MPCFLFWRFFSWPYPPPLLVASNTLLQLFLFWTSTPVLTRFLVVEVRIVCFSLWSPPLTLLVSFLGLDLFPLLQWFVIWRIKYPRQYLQGQHSGEALCIAPTTSFDAGNNVCALEFSIQFDLNSFPFEYSFLFSFFHLAVQCSLLFLSCMLLSSLTTFLNPHLIFYN